MSRSNERIKKTSGNRVLYLHSNTHHTQYDTRHPLAREEAFPVHQEQYNLNLVFSTYNYGDCNYGDLGGGRRDDRSVFLPPPGLTVSVLLSVLALR